MPSIAPRSPAVRLRSFRTSSRSVRFWLCALAVAVAVPFLLLIVGSAMAREDADRHAVDATLAARASAIATAADADLEHHAALLTGLAERAGVFPGVCDSLLGALAGSDRDVLDIRLFSPDGDLLCTSAGPASGHQGVLRLPWFAEALRTGGPVVAAPAEDPLSGRPAVTIAHAVDRTDPAAGVLALLLDLRHWVAPFAGTGFVGDENASIVTPEGVIVARTADPATAGTSIVGDALEGFLAMRRVGQGTVTAPSIGGGDFRIGFATLPNGWVVRAGTPVDQAFAPARQAFLRDIGTGLAIACVALVLALLVALRIAGPASRLAVTVAAAGHDPDIRAPVEGPTELRTVADAFNRLVSARLAVEARYRLLVERVPAIIFTDELTPQGHWQTTYLSPQVERILGHTPTELSVDGAWRAIVHPDDVGALYALPPSAGEVDVEYRVRARDGRIVWLREHGIRAVDGDRTTLSGVMLDVTATRQAEAALAEGEARYRALVECSPAGIGLIHPDGSFAFANDEFVRLLGVSAIAPSESFLDLFDPTEGDLVRDAIAGVMSPGAGSVAIETHIRARDGVERDVELIASAITTPDGTTGAQVWTRDISDRRRAEAERARLYLAIEQVPEAIVITDAAWRISYVNPAFVAQTGFTRDEIDGRDGSDLLFGAKPGPLVPYRRVLDELRVRGAWSGAHMQRRADGSMFEAEVLTTPVHDGSGRVSNHVVILRDVTRERLIEQQVYAGQKLEAIGQLAGGVAHDFNNLMCAVLGFASFALSKLPDGSPAHADVAAIKAAAERASELTSKLLAFSRRQSMIPEAIDVNTLVADSVAMLGRTIGEQCKLRIAPTEGLPPVFTDPAQASLVVHNLVLNARDAMPDGGLITITTERMAATTVAAALPGIEIPAGGDYVAFTVTDTGTGMSKEVLARIWEPFYSTKPVGKGTGLGLSSAYGIVRQSGGRIWAESEPGVGTTFTVALPVAARAVEPEDAPLPRLALPVVSARRAGGHERILLVEDEPAVREMVALSLRDLGYDVLVAEDAGEALERCSGTVRLPDLLVTDVVMPGLSGPDLADRLRALHPRLRVLFISGYSRRTLGFEMSSGVDGPLLSKPFGSHELAERVRGVLDAPVQVTAAA